MMSEEYGNERLKQNLSDQLQRCLSQLTDLEGVRHEMSTEEYEEQYNDTMEQLQQLHQSLDGIKSGSLTLLDDISSMQLAISAAISQAFHTPEILHLFASRQPDQLRQRLSMIERDRKISKTPTNQYIQEKCEILSALLKLRADLTDEEQDFLHKNTSQHLAHFIGTSGQTNANSNTVLQLAANSSN